MSQVKDINDQNEESNQTVANEQEVEQEQPIYMYYYWNDPITGQPRCQMTQDYVNYFQSMIDFTNQLKQTLNKSWKPEERDAYLLFLNDVQNYIYQYVYSGYIQDFNVFFKQLQEYGENRNKLGYDLYNHQCDYLDKKASGHFKLQKKKKKQANKKIEQPKPKPKQQKPKQEEIIRKDDPTITAAELKAKTWEPNKYANLDTFHLESANLIFIGHVDSGKSTLTGNIMKELKLVDQQELTRNKQEAKERHMESWELAFIADFDPNERIRGKTVECSKMMFNLQHRRFTLFDAPGHKNYVPSMIMGACQADIAVLIVSSKEGQFESGFEKQGQTKEHAMLAKALGVQSLIVGVTKMSTVDWSEARYNLIKQQVSPFLQNSCGFFDVNFIPLDSINNLNIHSRYEGTSWYKGPCLMEVLDHIKIAPRDADGPLRMPVVDKFKDAGQFYLYGKIESGKIAYENQTVSLLPRREYVIIKQIFNAKDQRLPYALAGENVKLKVKGIDEDQVYRGDIICSNTNYCQESMEFKANLTVLELPEHKKIMSSGYECIIHMHAIAEEAQILEVEAKQDKDTKKFLKATYLLPGQLGKVIIKLKNSVCLQKFDFMPSLGRFTLRDEGKTIGYGEVTKIKPAKALTKEQKDQLGLTKKEGEEASKQNVQTAKKEA